MTDNNFNDQMNLFCNELWKEMQQKFPLKRPLEDKEKLNQLIKLGNEIEKKRGKPEALNLTYKYNELSRQLGTNDNPLISDNVYISRANENLIHLVDAIKETNNNNAPTDIYEWTANICTKMETSEASREFKDFIIEFTGKENVEKMFPRPEPVVEKKKEFSTTSKDHKVRIEQWMEHVGLKDDANALIDKYGLLVAYEIVQTSMQAPADMTKATDGKFKSSKNTIKYFLDNDVPAEKLVMIPDLDAETVDLSLYSVKKPMEVSSKIAPLPEVPTIEIPSVVSTLPSASQLSAADIQKAHYASLMKNSVKLDGIADEEVKAAVDFAFKEAVRCQTDDMEAWTGNFRFNLTKALGLEEIAKDQDEYKKWSKNIITNSNNAVEVSAAGNPDEALTEQIDAYSRVVSNQKLRVDLVSMSAKDTLNADVYFKDRQLQKKLEAREAKKAAKEARKAERAENRKEKIEEIRAFFKGGKSILD